MHLSFYTIWDVSLQAKTGQTKANKPKTGVLGKYAIFLGSSDRVIDADMETKALF